MSFFSELKRRNVYKVAVAYAVVGWLLIQVATQTFPFFDVPNWAVRLVILLVVIGFPIALVIAWAFELTPEGLKRTEPGPHTARHASRNRAWIYVAGVAGLLSLAIFFLGRYSVPSAKRIQPGSEKSIAVLPLVNHSGDPAQEYFSDGLSDELINGLAQIRGLTVIGRNSSFHFKGKTEDSRAVGEALGVAHLLEGSVRKAGDRVRISVALVDAANGRQRWSQVYDRELKDIFAVQTEIARSVADQLLVTLLGNPLSASAEPSNGNLEAYNAYLQGQYFNRTSNLDNLMKAIVFFDEAIRHDPKYADAFALKSLAWAQIAYVKGAKGADEWEKARAAAQAALAIKPDLARARGALAYVYVNEWNLTGAESELTTKGADDARSIPHMLALVRFCQGRKEEAIELEQRAILADPAFGLFRRNLGVVLIAAGRFEDGERELRKAMELQPQSSDQHLALVELALLRRQPEAALREAEQEPPGVFRDVAMALAHASQPGPNEADGALRSLIERHGDDAPFRIALVYAYRREPDKLFEWLDRAYAARDPRLIRLLTTPFLEPFKTDARFIALCEKLALSIPK
ncbi:MAG TPA: hypothetical protein VF511_10830 [Chthoniobacterales bacterium]|jgi:serine/threonine-protein kinase